MTEFIVNRGVSPAALGRAKREPVTIAGIRGKLAARPFGIYVGKGYTLQALHDDLESLQLEDEGYGPTTMGLTAQRNAKRDWQEGRS